MKGKKICKRCQEKILPEDKYTMLGTFQGDKTIRKDYWHFQCFLDWFNESVHNRAMKVYNESMKGALQKLPEFLGGIGIRA